MDELQYWINKEELNNIYTSNYWNNSEHEKSKEWWINNDRDEVLSNYIEHSGLKEELELSIDNSNIKGKVLDLAAGTCWVSSILSKIKEVESIDAVEFSYHRIKELAPKTIDILDGNKDKINRILGNFYNVKQADNYYDTIILSQAYHHAEYPLKLFHECDRVLKTGGTIIMIGEHVISKECIIKRFIKRLFKGEIALHLSSDLYQYNNPLGDHYYMLNDYKFTFNSYGYGYKIIKSNIRNSSIFVAKKESKCKKKY